MKYPLFKVHIDKVKALNEIGKVIDSGFLNEGETVLEFTKCISEMMQSEKVICLNSCTTAITLALRLANVKKGDEVITPSQTCIATNTPIIDVGATPIFADIDSSTGTLSSSEVENLITDKTKAVICVAWAGMPPYLEELQELCRSKNIALIQDAAQAFGAEYYGKPICHFADFTCYSFQAIKHLTTGDGGALVCGSEKDYKRAMRLKWFGIDKEQNNKKENIEGERWRADVEEAGYKYHMNNIDAAIGLSQVTHIDGILESHRFNASVYESIFFKNDKIFPMTYPVDSLPSFWTYVVLLDQEVNRDKVLMELNSEGIQAGLMHTPNHYYSCFGKADGNYPETDYFSDHQISLPCGWWLSEDDVRLIADVLMKKAEEHEN